MLFWLVYVHVHCTSLFSCAYPVYVCIRLYVCVFYFLIDLMFAERGLVLTVSYLYPNDISCH